MTTDAMLYPHRHLPNGRCGCSQCIADEQRDIERRDQALAAVVFDLGVEQLRLAALDRIPAFQEKFA